MKLFYFSFPGRAECARLCLVLGDIPFEDVRIPMSRWPTMKASMPFQQVPVLELDDGRRLAQMAAIDHYCASLAGLLPADPLQCAQAESAYCFIADIWQPIGPVMMGRYANDEEKAAAWRALVQGPLADKLALLDRHLAQRAGTWVGGDELSYYDLSIFGSLSLFQSGWMSGLPRDILSGFPALKQFRNLVASQPRVVAYYQQQIAAARPQGDDVRAAFLPDNCREQSLAATLAVADAPQGTAASTAHR